MPDQLQDREPMEIVTHILKVSEETNGLKDVDAILDKILYESRRLANADAGTIFLVKDGMLHFSYVHNDTLFVESDSNKHLYLDYSLPIDSSSIVGFVAESGNPLEIEDVYKLDSGLPYGFNSSFDEQAGYRTKSMLTLPIRSSQNSVVGVMQLINAKNEAGRSVRFSKEASIFLPILANNASVSIERGLMTRELILRMMRMAELRYPSETRAHVQRVGAYSAEIYRRWALDHGVEESEIKRVKDVIRIAAMLHDVGKVGISDLILTKPGKLTADEFTTMKFHTVYGAQLFANSTSALDSMSRDIALNHHERFDGSGYPGHVTDLDGLSPALGPGKRGEEIPISARIAALADVFDALCSQRSYKAEWDDGRVLDLVMRERGRHFDPEVVDAFLSIFDVIKAIREKFREEGTRNIECALESKVDAAADP